MTREEFEQYAKENGLVVWSKEMSEQAIKALNQEPTTKIEESNFSQEQYLADIQSAYDCGKSVIDKIRAEIKQEYKDEFEHPYGHGLRRAIEIIDKYKAESEPQESEVENG